MTHKHNNILSKKINRFAESQNVTLPKLNALVAVGKGMRAVKRCTNKILQFLTGADNVVGGEANCSTPFTFLHLPL